jgi:hypothetical protein
MNEVQKYDQPTAKPTAKISAVGGAGIVIGSIVAILTIFGVTVPDGLPAQAEAAVSAVVLIITFVQGAFMWLAGYLKKSEKKV